MGRKIHGALDTGSGKGTDGKQEEEAAVGPPTTRPFSFTKAPQNCQLNRTVSKKYRSQVFRRPRSHTNTEGGGGLAGEGARAGMEEDGDGCRSPDSHLGIRDYDLKEEEGVGPGVGMPGPEEAEYQAPPNWWTDPDFRDHYLCLYVRDAKDLPVKDNDIRSASTCVKIRFGGDAEGNPAASGAIPGPGVKPLEAQTRVVHHMRDPFFGQGFFFPLAALTPSMPVNISVHNPGLLDTFCGHIQTTMEHFLMPTNGPVGPLIQWFKLQKKRGSGDRVGGELCLLITIVPAYAYNVLQWSESPETLLDPQMLKALLQPYSLRLHVEELRHLKIPHIMSRTALEGILKNLSVQVRVGRSVLNKKVTPKDVLRVNEVNRHGKSVVSVSFKIDDVITFPLEETFSVLYNRLTKKRQKEEVGDVRVYLMDGKEIICKTQVPVWDIPVYKLPPKREPRASVPEGMIPEMDNKLQAGGPDRQCFMGAFDLWVEILGEQQQEASTRGGGGGGTPGEGGETRVTGGRPSSPFPRRGSMANLLETAKNYNKAGAAPGGGAGTGADGARGSKDSEVFLSVLPGLQKAAAASMPKTTEEEQSSPLAVSGNGSGRDPQFLSPTKADADASVHPLVEIPPLTGLAIARNFARSKAGPSGMRYRRACEIYSTDIEPTCPEMVLSAVLINTKELAQNEAVKGVQGCTKDEGGDETSDDEEEEVRADLTIAPSPIDLPPAQPVLVSEAVVGIRPMQLFDKLFSPDSEFRNKMTTKEVLVNVVTGDWEADPSNPKGKIRRVNYTRPISIPLPMSPKKCDVTEVHSMMVREAGGFVMEAKVTTNAPKGDTFFVLIQWAAVADGSGRSRLRVSFKVEFIKSVGFLKGAIEGGALGSTKKLLKAWVDALVLEVGKGPGDSLASTSVPTVTSAADSAAVATDGRATSRGLADAALALAAGGVLSQGGSVQQLQMQGQPLLAMWRDGVALLLLLLLVLSLFSIGSSIREVAQSLERLAAVSSFSLSSAAATSAS